MRNCYTAGALYKGDSPVGCLQQRESLRPSRSENVVIGCLVVGMALIAPDIFSQTLLAVPMWLLVEVGVLCSGLIRKCGDAA